MAKTLSESAAEILNASIGKNQEPMNKMPAEVNDLGGDTPTNAAGTVGAPNTKKMAAPGSSGAAGDTTPVQNKGTGSGMKGDIKPVGKGGFGDSVEHDGENVISEDETTEESAELSEEEIAKARTSWKKDMVAKHKGSMKEDVDALFNGESLSEDFRVKATLIFESAVQSRVEKIVEDVLADNDKVLEEAYESIKVELSEKVDEYLNYVVEEWVKDNQVAIESGLRAELSEDFINGLKNLFAEHYIEIPDEKLDVAEELANKVVELEESVATAKAEFDSVRKELNEAKKNEAIRKICEGLTETQIAKLKSLAEGVEFTTEGDFDNKLAVIRENYFPTKTNVMSEVKVAQEASEGAPEVDNHYNDIMSRYVQAITKSLPK